MAFDSPQATQLNKEIFECIYYTALKVSCELAQKEGAHMSCLGAVRLIVLQSFPEPYVTAVAQVVA